MVWAVLRQGRVRRARDRASSPRNDLGPAGAFSRSRRDFATLMPPDRYTHGGRRSFSNDSSAENPMSLFENQSLIS
jgi:hypothetical protein